MNVVCEGEKARSTRTRHIFGQLRVGDMKQKLPVSDHIVNTTPRFGVVAQPREGNLFCRAYCTQGG